MRRRPREGASAKVLLAAVRAIGVSESLASTSDDSTASQTYRWRKDDREFAEKAEEVIEDRAVKGVPRGVYYKDERIGEDREYDTRAAEFYLRGRTKLRRY
jgi:hypothetical protein